MNYRTWVSLPWSPRSIPTTGNEGEFMRDPFFKLLASLRNRTAERWGRQNARVWQTWQGYYLRVLLWSSLTLMFSGLLQKDLFKRGWNLAKNVFQTNLLSRLSHKVCHLLSSPVLLRKFTIICVVFFNLTFLFTYTLGYGYGCNNDFTLSKYNMSHILYLQGMLLSYWSEAELYSSKQTYSWTPGEMVCRFKCLRT